MGGEGFEPSKAEPTGLQPVPFGHSGIRPRPGSVAAAHRIARVERFDAIVVGAGPAGSTAAYRLASAGARTLLLDRARFPRDKPCGGGLTVRAVRALPFPVEPVVEHVVDRLELCVAGGPSVERRGRGPLVLMTQRRRLDAYLAERAVVAGADFRDGSKVTALELADDGVEIEVGGARFRGAVLVGADGANGVVARALGVDGGYTRGVALEGNAPFDPRFRGRAVVELGTVAGGYGWVFPKGDHVNVGVGGWSGDGPVLRERLTGLCGRLGVEPGSLADLRGHRLPLRPRAARAVRGRVLLVGDAAGLIDPVSGDGMYEAFVS